MTPPHLESRWRKPTHVPLPWPTEPNGGQAPMFNLIMDPVPATQQSRDNEGLTQYAQLTDNTGRARPERERRNAFNGNS